MRIVRAKKVDIRKCLEIKVSETKADRRLIRENLLTALNDKNHLFFVAKLRGEIIGYINGKIDDWNSSMFVQELFVNKPYRGKGIGAKLLDRFKDIGINKDLRIIFLDVPPINKKARSFYRKYGFAVAGEIKGLYKTHSKAIVLSYKL